MPVLFTGLLRTTGQLGPAEQPAKRDWMLRNIARKAALLDIPLNAPRHHPFNPLLALRASSLDMAEDCRWRLIDAFMRGIWVDGLHVSETADVCQVAETVGLDGPRLVAGASEPDAARRLEQQTQGAIDRGVFGIPSLIYGGELFFGYDDFMYLEMALQGSDPLQNPGARTDWLRAGWTPSRHAQGRSRD